MCSEPVITSQALVSISIDQRTRWGSYAARARDDCQLWQTALEMAHHVPSHSFAFKVSNQALTQSIGRQRTVNRTRCGRRDHADVECAFRKRARGGLTSWPGLQKNKVTTFCREVHAINFAFRLLSL